MAANSVPTSITVRLNQNSPAQAINNSLANSAYNQANIAYIVANSAYNYANTLGLTTLTPIITGGQFGSNTQIPQISVDVYGRVNAISNINIQTADITHSGIVQLNDTLVSNSIVLSSTANVANTLNNLIVNLNSVDNTIFNKLNNNSNNISLVWSEANTIYNISNTNTTNINSAFNEANLAYIVANSSYNYANSLISLSPIIIGNSYGSNAVIPTFTVDNYGRINNISNVNIQIGSINTLGIVQLNDTLNSNSIILASTANVANTLSNLINTNFISLSNKDNVIFNITNTNSNNISLIWTEANTIYNIANSANSIFTGGNIVGKLNVGNNYILGRFPNTIFSVSDGSGSETHPEKFAICGESTGVGVYGVGYSNGSTFSCGVMGDGTTANVYDTAPSIGVKGYSTVAHINGLNIALYANAYNSILGNYALYFESGDIYSLNSQKWTLPANTNALNFSSGLLQFNTISNNIYSFGNIYSTNINSISNTSFAAFNEANTAYSVANSSYNFANNNSNNISLVWTEANTIYNNVNNNSNNINSAFNEANIAYNVANSSYNYANGIIGLSPLSTSGNYGSNTTIPVFTVDIYGRINVISNTNIQTADITHSGIVQLNDTLLSTSNTLASTANVSNTLNNSIVIINGNVNTIFNQSNTNSNNISLVWSEANTIYNNVNNNSNSINLAFNQANNAYARANSDIRSNNLVSDIGSLTIDISSTQFYAINALAQTITINNVINYNNVSDGTRITIRIRSAIAQTIVFGNMFRGSTDLALPTTTTGGNKTDYYGFSFNYPDTKLDLLATNLGF